MRLSLILLSLLLLSSCSRYENTNDGLPRQIDRFETPDSICYIYRAHGISCIPKTPITE